MVGDLSTSFLNFLANLRDFLVPTLPGSPSTSRPRADIAGGCVKYSTAFCSRARLSRNFPNARLHIGQSNPRIRPVRWQWSTLGFRIGLRQIAHNPF